MTSSNAAFRSQTLGPPPWPTRDPFLFCVHHLDVYPPGNDALGPDASLEGRRMGMDFEVKDGFRMYHGEVVPGFPAHPHRGFETVTLARQGHIDHSDSLGATARFGEGDVQWMTAGRGIVHAEMFPVLRKDAPNPGELFQIWLNLPARKKRVEPHFSMLWSPTIPRWSHPGTEAAPGAVEVTVVAGAFEGLGRSAVAPPPPPNSWASEPNAGVLIWAIKMDAQARFQLPAAAPGVDRSVYLFRPSGPLEVTAGETRFEKPTVLFLEGPEALAFETGDHPAELLVLGGRPIDEPVAHHGPFVMNTRAELVQAFEDYQHTQFGGWPWPSPEPVHARDRGRFAQFPDGRVEEPA